MVVAAGGSASGGGGNGGDDGASPLPGISRDLPASAVAAVAATGGAPACAAVGSAPQRHALLSCRCRRRRTPAMDLVATKIVVLVLLGVIRLACGLLPLKITQRLQTWGEQQTGSRLLVHKRRLQIERGLSLCLCFGGGVLLATCFIHMLPEARESLEAARRASAPLLPPPSESSFPFAELFVCVGFFLVYVIEEVAHRLFAHHPGAKAATAESTGSGDSSVPSDVTTDASAAVVLAPAPLDAALEKPPPPLSPPPSDGEPPPPPPQCCATVEAEFHKMEALAGAGDVERGPWTRPKSTSKIAPATSQMHLFSSSLSLEHKDPSSDVHLHHHHHVHHVDHHHHHHHAHPHHHLHPHLHHHHIPISKGESSMLGHLRSILVVLALSFHSVFEGLAIGLQPTTRDVWYLFTAVAIHASAILFCVGLELVMSGMRLLSMLAYLTLLALVSPLGVALGVAVTSAGGSVDADGGGASPGQTLAVGALQAVAGGTILYITFFEVLDREKRRSDSAGPLRLTCVLAGFAVMVALQVIGGHEHNGEDGHMVGSTNSSERELHRHGS